MSELEAVIMISPLAAISTMNRRQIFGLALLVAVNCLLLGLAELLLSLWLPLDGTKWTFFLVRLFSNGCEGIFTAQFLLIGFWCALAPERLVVRLLVGILLGGLLLGIYFLFFGLATTSLTLSDLTEQAGKYCGLALIAFILVRALRPWFGWRLAWDAAIRIPQSRQFRILDLLAWTTAVAIPPGLLQTLYGAAAPWLAIVTAVEFTRDLPVTIPILCWAICPARKHHWLIALLLWGSLWPACLVLLCNIGFLFFGRAGLPFWKDSLMMFLIWSAYYLPMVLVFTGNMLALGKIGLRPVAKSAPAGP